MLLNAAYLAMLTIPYWLNVNVAAYIRGCTAIGLSSSGHRGMIQIFLRDHKICELHVVLLHTARIQACAITPYA